LFRSVVAAARRASGDRFTCAGPTDDDEVSIALPPTGSLAVTFRDADGAPVPGLEARLRPWLDLDELTDHVVGADAPREARRDGDRLVFDAVPVGAYRLLARSAATGLVTRAVDVREGTTELDVRIGTPRALDVRAIDRRSGRPVEHARLTLFSSTERPALLAARTDADGRARLGPTPDDRDRWTVRAEHPAYAVAYVEVDPDAGAVDVALDGGGALAARFSARGNPPAEPHTLHLRLDPYAGDDRHVLDEVLPWFATSDARGDVHVPHLPAGRYRYEVRPALPPGDGLAALAALDPTDRPLRRGTLEIEAGETVELRVELAGDDGPPARVRGSLTLDGAPAAARLQVLVVDAAGETTSRAAVAGDDGRFAFADLPAGAGRLVGSFEDGPSTGVAFEERFELAPGDERVVDVALRTHAVPVRVTKDGRPVAGAQVWGKDGTRSQWAETDARGIAPLRTFAAGALRLRAAHDLGIAHADVDVPDGGLAAPLEVALGDGVPFAGTFTLDHALAAANGPLVLRVTFYDGNLFASRSIPLDDGARSFRVLGLDPGTFWVELRVGRAESERIEFTLDASGSETLSFAFEAD
ncbi:MAG: collagen binding domain-containing protein, partial [Planctomycetota bacterium JB042]